VERGGLVAELLDARDSRALQRDEVPDPHRGLDSAARPAHADAERGEDPVFVERGQLQVLDPHRARLEPVTKQGGDGVPTAMNASARSGGELDELGVGGEVVARQERREVGSGRVVQLVQGTKVLDVGEGHAAQ
jgi:hypothetical protein